MFEKPDLYPSWMTCDTMEKVSHKEQEISNPYPTLQQNNLVTPGLGVSGLIHKLKSPDDRETDNR